jgi:hypothetical protein
MKQNVTNKSPKILKKYFCEKCNYVTCNIKDYNKHLSTRKHNLKQNVTEKSPKIPEIILQCEFCNKDYNNRTSLWRHKKKCKINNDFQNPEEETDLNYKEMFLEIMKKNSEITDIMVEQQKTIQTIIPSINKTVNNTNNQVFNINMFLNEQCKDAMNISDFIESIQLNLEDMTKIGKEGQTKGMANILIDKLNTIDILKRPVHCSDIKKETIYIKDKDIWEEENQDKTKLKSALDKLTKKSIDAMPCMEDDPDAYIKTVSEVIKDPREDKKIISKLIKEILV